jgi:hypothetical protein
MRRLRRLLASDAARASAYLAVGAVLLVVVVIGFGDAWTQARLSGTRDPLSGLRSEPVPTPRPDRLVPPAKVEFPFY